MKRFNFFGTAILAILLIIILIPLYNQSKTKTFRSMGTEISITVDDLFPYFKIEEAYRKIKSIEALLNRFDPKSELSRINREAYLKPVEAKEETLNCIAKAIEVSRLTNGAFDITLSGNYGNIFIDKNKKTVSFKKSGFSINLDAIGKGFAVEEAKKLLFNLGAKSAIIDGRSSIAIIGEERKIGIKNPLSGGVLDFVFLSSGEALSTSGNYEQGDHIINPKTGIPANEIISVTIKGTDAGFLDALYTGVFVLGEKKGSLLLKKLNMRGTMLLRNGKVLKI